ncbi:MAG: hypothetical protein L6R38_004613 [Xanthoria sp. 2 TBL-2021]|nr:MAG: hypothetical protein L6R38_004613 [Xanthoria sp. 2 TBL-2021]
MSSRDTPPPPRGKKNGSNLPGGVLGNFHNGQPGVQGPQVNLERSKLFQSSMAGVYYLQQDIVDRPVQVQRPLNHVAIPGPDTARVRPASGVHLAPGRDNASIEITEDEHKELDDLTEERDDAHKALERAQRRLDDAQQRVSQRLQWTRVLHDSSNFRTNQQLRPATSATDTNSRFTTTSSLGKRSNGNRGENKDENGSLQTGSRTRRRPNSEHTTEFSGPPHTSAGNALRSLHTLGRRRHLHPSPTMRPPGPQAGTFHQAFTHGGAASTYDDSYLQDHLPNPFSTAAHTQRPPETRGYPFYTIPITGKRSRDDSDTNDGASWNGDEGPNEAQTEEPPKVMPLTKRQKKRQEMVSEGKDIPKDDEKVKGVIKVEDGNLFHLHNGKWEPAAYHHERRLGLFAREAVKGTYTYPPTAGTKEEDKTAYHPHYANINMSVREGRPHLLYQWDPPKEQTPFIHPGLMRDPEDGILLLDANNHPIFDWPELPKTISAQVEGFWLEYWWRLNRHIRIEDVLARCPEMTQRKDSTLYRPIATRSAYGNSRSKDRLAAGTRSWEQKEGSKEIKAQYERIMPNKVLAEIAHRGTTTFFRDLTPKETSAICHINKGKGTALSRAGNKKLSEAKKKERKAKSDPELEAIYRRLLREQHDADRLDPRWAQEGGPDPGWAFPDPAAGSARVGTATTTGYGQSVNTQIPGPANNASNDTTFFENEGDTTLVEDDQTYPANHGFNHSYASTQSIGHYDGVQGSIAQQGIIGNTTDPGPGYHWLVPNTPQEKLSITNALENARQSCRVMTRDDPPRTNANDCYMNQFHELEEWLNNKLSSTDPGKALPVLHPWINWYGGWDAWNSMDLNYDDLQLFEYQSHGKLNEETNTGKKPEREQHTLGLDFNPAHVRTRQDQGILAPNKIRALKDSLKHDPAAVRKDPTSSANAGAPPGYVAAKSLQHAAEPDRPLWEMPLIQQPNEFDGPLYQMEGNPTFSQDQNAIFDSAEFLGTPDRDFENFMSNMPKKESPPGDAPGPDDHLNENYWQQDLRESPVRDGGIDELFGDMEDMPRGNDFLTQ